MNLKFNLSISIFQDIVDQHIAQNKLFVDSSKAKLQTSKANEIINDKMIYSLFIEIDKIIKFLSFIRNSIKN
jgi:hypothetical protein